MIDKNLKVGAVTNWVSMGVHLVVGIILTPIVISYVGKNGFAIWALVNSFSGYYGLLNLGIGSALGRFSAVHLAKKDWSSFNGVVNTAVQFFTVTGLLVCVFGFVFAQPLTQFFSLGGSDGEVFVWLMRIFAAVALLEFIASVFGSLLFAREKFVFLNALAIFRSFANLGVGIALLHGGAGLLGIALLALGLSAVTTVAKVVYCKMAISELRFSPKLASRSVLVTLLKFGVGSSLISVAQIVRLRVGLVLSARMVGVDAAAVYAIAINLVDKYINVVGSASRVVSPRFATLVGRGENDNLRILFLDSLRWCAWITAGGWMLLIVFAKPLVLLWVGEEFVDAALIINVLSVGVCMALAQTTGLNACMALAKHRSLAWMSIFELVLGVLLAWGLVRWGGLGNLGIALGITLGMLSTKTLLQPLYVCRMLELSLAKFVRTVIPPFAVAGAFVACNLGAREISGENWSRLEVWIPFAIVTGVGYLLVFWRMFSSRRLSVTEQTT